MEGNEHKIFMGADYYRETLQYLLCTAIGIRSNLDGPVFLSLYKLV